MNEEFGLPRTSQPVTRTDTMTARQEVCDLIRNAFADARYPDDDRIVVPYEGDDERQRIERDFRGKKWQDISIEFLCPEHCESILTFLPHAFAYYLPAFLIAATDFRKADILTDMVVASLYDRPAASSEPFVAPALELMSVDQLRAILAFIAYLRSQHWDGDNSPELAKAEASILSALEHKGY